MYNVMINYTYLLKLRNVILISSKHLGSKGSCVQVPTVITNIYVWMEDISTVNTKQWKA